MLRDAVSQGVASVQQISEAALAVGGFPAVMITAATEAVRVLNYLKQNQEKK